MEKGNLLLVDDETILLKHMQSSLEDIADRIFVAENGIEALSILERESIQCIVCDINMPKMNGIEVIKRLHEKKVTIPFIFYTGHGSNDLMDEAARFGAFDFLNKPNLTGLEEVVERGLKSGRGEKSDEAAEDIDDLLKDL